MISPTTTLPLSDPVPAGVVPRRLVVLVPAMNSHSSQWASLREQLEKETGYRDQAEAHWFPFDHGIKLWTPGHVEALAKRLRNRIHEEWTQYGDFEDVVLIGHSLGGIIARRAYLLAAGAVPGQPASPWGQRVSRIVLFASVNRGLDLDRTWWARPIAWLARALPLPHLCCEDCLRGSDFLTNLRIDWIRHFHALEAVEQESATGQDAPPPRAPLVVQFRGDDDWVVTSTDSEDVLAFPNSNYTEVADATHADLYRLDRAHDPEARYALLRQAFIIPPATMRASAPADPVKRVVFLLHGVRASNTDDWVEQLEASLIARDPVGIKVARPTYGYFTALRFALPSVRKKNIRFFQDEYTEQLARHPRAEFDIIAHSNGSYILGHSLRRTSGMRFKNVILAGSPLPQDYPWAELVQGNPSQIGRVRNERAKSDWVIAILCNALRAIFMRDVGPGGFAGFYGAATLEVAYHDGDHGKALQPQNHERMIDYVLGGPETRPTDLVDTPGIYRQLSNLAPYAAWGIILAVLASLVVIARLSFQNGVFNPLPLLGALITFLFLYVLADII